ncbi:Lpg1974 family pore-forming outer membrane protein [Legionella sp. 227]|uniref:Lpg1974 family pore-forming outer membrane protein n=1 Tax=Legionella sp. 227 TaxID=3367288 RepID=UPI00370DBC85
MKKIGTFLFIALNTSLLHAGAMGVIKPSCETDDVTVPCPCNAWEIGISALYLQPNTNSDLLNPALTVKHFQTDGTITQTSNTIKSSWDWGFLLEGGYHFNTGNDLNLNWLHFRGNHSSSVLTFINENPAVNPFIADNTTQLRFDTYFDAVNLELAQSSSFGENTDIRFYGGGQYVNSKIKRAEYDFENVIFFPPNTLFQESVAHTKFQGAGPRVGIDMAHKLNHGFAVFAQSATAILLGERKAKLSGANISGPNAFPFSAQAKGTHIVPELEAKLGLSYQWGSCISGQLTLMGGWMWQHYFDMFLLPPGGNSNPATVVTQNDFSLDGPFIKAKWLS